MTEIGEIPNEWEIKSLDECTIKITDGSHSSPIPIEESSYKICTVANMKKYSLDTENSAKISEEDYRKLIKNGCGAEQGDVLLSKDGTVGKTLVFSQENDNLVFLSSIAIIRTDKNILSGEYLNQYLKDSKTLDRLMNTKTGSAIKRIVLKDIRNTKIVVPKLNEQEKIASILSTVDEQIDNVYVLIEKNKELKKGLMQILLTKGIGHTKFKKTEIGEIPEEWEIKELSELYSENIRDFGSFSTTKLIEYVEEGIPYLRAENFRENKIVLNSVSYITEEVDKLLDKSHVYDGNILFTKIGNIGCATVYRGELGTRCNSNATIAKIKIDENIYDSNYIVYFLNSLQCKRQYIGSIISTPPRINMGEISKFKIAIPKLYEQTQIASILLEVDNKIEEYENKKMMFEKLKRGLMQQLLTGIIRVK